MRNFNIQLGPRDRNDEDRLLRFVFRNAKPGDTVNVSCGQADQSEQPSRVANERLETRIGESIERRLESKNEQLGCQALPANDAELAKQRARDTHGALLRVRGSLEQAVYTVAAEIVVRGAWQQIVAIAQMM